MRILGPLCRGSQTRAGLRPAAKPPPLGISMSELIVSVSGIRGIIGAGLSPTVALTFAQALGSYLKGGRVVLSRDSRPSGQMLRHAVVAGLASCGCDIVDLG